ncbi:atos homolog protein A-like isoform X2 [Hyla sarda]|uniref:atos homolog protein A-like isoform X2 n=1 Tax=Hyla sarda TaxID=327740 RepID=UPI0024C35D2C|nr:atos homolog protein A-like isoform X2 [Hyla sarda]
MYSAFGSYFLHRLPGGSCQCWSVVMAGIGLSCDLVEELRQSQWGHSDSLDEFFEYEAEDFLVYLALLITEGRTPEHSVKGRTEGLHCPPAQSSQPGANKHECSDKVPKCRQARKTRSEVTLLWRNNLPIMVEVMLLPDCCYSDEASGTEGNDFNDPAMKQDALLLERWTLEPVPRQSGDRFIEEKTLLLAVRSFVFFSQLSAWLSVSHGAVPRNIIYRISAADGELQWNFTHPPTEHVFPVPNVSHNVALKVSVQSLPRQSSYPVLNCSIHSNLGLYEKKFLSHEQIGPPPREHQESSQQSAPSFQHTCSKQTWTVGSDGLLQAKTSLSMNLMLPGKNVKLISGCGNSCDVGTSPSKIHCFSISDPKTALQGSPVRNFKSLSLVDTPNNSPVHQQTETNPLIGSLIQERQEVIARIAQHLLQCDQTTSHITTRSFKMHDPTPMSCKILRNPCEDENFNKIETPVMCAPISDLTLTPENGDRKQKAALDTPITSSRPCPDGRTSPKPQARRKLILVQAHEPVLDTFQHSVNKYTPPAFSLSSKENIFMAPDRGDLKYSEQNEKYISKGTLHHLSSHSTLNVCSANRQTSSAESRSSDSVHLDNRKNCSRNVVAFKTCGVPQTLEPKCTESNTRKAHGSDHSNQLHSIENYVTKDRDSQKAKETQEKQKTAHDENEDPTKCDCGAQEQGKAIENCLSCERLKNTDQTSVPLRPSNVWKKKGFHSLDGISTKAFHPCTGLPLLSSPVPQRKTQSGYFDLDTSLLQFKGLSTKRRHCEKTENGVECTDRQLSCSAPPAPCLSLLGNFEESVLNYRLEPLGTVEGFTADVGASGVFCPTHMTLPVRVSFFSVSEDNAPSPYMGNITLESLGKRGYRIPPSGTIQVTLFNPNKTVVKMFVVKYDLQKMPPNHQTFLRQRTFSVPGKRDKKVTVPENIMKTEERTLRYLIHLRFQSSKSGKIYLHKDVRLLFSRKSMEVDSGAAYELKSYIETPTNPQFSSRC